MSVITETRKATGAPAAGIAFAMRYPDDVGYVWNALGRIFDSVAEKLQDRVRCYSTYPKLTGSAAYAPKFMTPREVDFYSNSPEDRRVIEKFVADHDIRTVVYSSCDPASIDLPWLRRLGLRTVCYEQDSYDEAATQPFWKRIAKEVLRRRLEYNLHDLYAACSEHQRKFLLDFAALPSRRVIATVNGIDTDRFAPATVNAAALGLPATDYYAVSISQSRPVKRIDFLIDVAAEVFRRNPELSMTFVHVGDGLTFEADKAKAKSLGLGERFVFVGRQNDTLPYHRLASFLIHAADRESFGLVLAEAMACGKPVIATAAAGPKEIIDPEVTGILLDGADVSTFADAIQRLTSNSELRTRMGEAARERAKQFFSLQRQSDAFAHAFINRGFV